MPRLQCTFFHQVVRDSGIGNGRRKRDAQENQPRYGNDGVRFPDNPYHPQNPNFPNNPNYPPNPNYPNNPNYPPNPNFPNNPNYPPNPNYPNNPNYPPNQGYNPNYPPNQARNAFTRSDRTHHKMALKSRHVSMLVICIHSNIFRVCPV